MDKYKVKINPKAIRELDHIYEYIANENLHRKTKEILHRKIIRISILKNVDFYTEKTCVAFVALFFRNLIYKKHICSVYLRLYIYYKYLFFPN